MGGGGVLVGGGLVEVAVGSGVSVGAEVAVGGGVMVGCEVAVGSGGVVEMGESVGAAVDVGTVGGSRVAVGMGEAVGGGGVAHDTTNPATANSQHHFIAPYPFAFSRFFAPPCSCSLSSFI